MGSYTGTVPTLLAAEYADADKLVEVTNLMTALTAAWTSYTPTWTATAGSPAVGNGTLAGRYRQIGKTVNVQIWMVAGSTTTFGSGGGQWRFSLPVTALDTNDTGSCYIFNSGVQTRPGVCHLISTTTVAPDSVSGTCTPTVPQAWATADECRISLTYSAA